MHGIEARLKAIEDKLEDLTKFKFQMLSSARVVAFLTSAFFSLFNLAAAVALVYYTMRSARS